MACPSRFPLSSQKPRTRLSRYPATRPGSTQPGIRSSVLYREERLTRDDKLMVVKNCYQFLEDIPDLDFIANGDVAKLIKLSRHEERYGLHFADAVLAFPDYNDVEVRAKVVLDTLDSEQPSLSAEQPANAAWQTRP